MPFRCSYYSMVLANYWISIFIVQFILPANHWLIIEQPEGVALCCKYILSLWVIFMYFSQAYCNSICLHVSWSLLPLSSASVFLLPFYYFLNTNHKTNSHDKIHEDKGTSLAVLSGKRNSLQKGQYGQYFRGWPYMFFGIMHLCMA